MTGWRPEVELRDGLIRTLDWYRDHAELRPRRRRVQLVWAHVRALHRHHQGHEEDRRPLPGRAREGAGTQSAARRRKSRPRTAPRAKEKAPPGFGRFNVAPTQEVLVVRASPEPEEAEQGEREARLMRWGLVPVWAKDLKVGYRMINAKKENLTEKPRLRAAGRQVPPPLPDRRRRLLRVDEGRGSQAAAPALALPGRRRRALRLRRPLHPQGVGPTPRSAATTTATSTPARW